MSHESSASARLKIDFAQASDPGRDPNKQVNEDSCGYAETRFGHLAVLCDGMGGHYGGQEASRTAIATIFEVFETLPLNMSPAQALKGAIEEAGRRVYRLGGPPENRTRPGSTVVAMLLHDRGLDVAHVGDSRAYIIRSNQIYPLTRDHSMVQGMIDAGMLTEESAMGHPDSNKITRALGMKPEVDVELRPEPMELFTGDVLMQSSDGLTDLALGRDILGATRQALASGGVDHACSMLVKMANDRGGHDNITVQMLRIADVSAKPITTIPERPVAMGPSPNVGAPNPAPAGPAQMPGTAQALAGTAPMQALSPQGWGGTQPTSPDAAPGAPPAQGFGQPPAFGAPPAQPPQQQPKSLHGQMPAPTLNEMPAYEHAPASKPWTSGQYQPLPPTPGPGPAQGNGPAPAAPTAQGLAPYRVDAPGALPLPPPSGRNFGGAPPAAAPMASQVQATGPMSVPGGFSPAPGGFAPPGGMVAPQPAKGGVIVYVIIGLSAVIAILILVVVWALWLR